MDKAWAKAAAKMEALGIPTELDAFIDSFRQPGEPAFSKQQLEDFLAGDGQDPQDEARFLAGFGQLRVGVYMPLSFVTEQDGSIAEFLTPIRSVGKRIVAKVKADPPIVPIDDLPAYFSALSKIMEIQAKSPFAICYLTAIASIRQILDAFCATLARDDLNPEVLQQLRSSIRLTPISFDAMMRAEIGFVFFSCQSPVTEEYVEVWKHASKMAPGFRKDYRSAKLRQLLPGAGQNSAAHHLELKCDALAEFRRNPVKFRPERFTEIMTPKGPLNWLKRSMVGEGSTHSFEFALKFERSIPHIQRWMEVVLDHILDPSLPPVSYLSEYVEFEVVGGEKLQAEITLKAIDSDKNRISFSRSGPIL